MTTIAEWYERVNAAWPARIPALRADEAVRAAKRLYRFAMKRPFRGDVKVTSGNRYTWVRGATIVINPDRGWHDLVHGLSHWCHRRLTTDKPHSRSHARLELRMVKEVVRRGYLDGKLRDKPRPAKAAPTRDEVRALRYTRTLAAIARWEAKAKRAENALRKLARRRRYYERLGLGGEA